MVCEVKHCSLLPFDDRGIGLRTAGLFVVLVRSQYDVIFSAGCIILVIWGLHSSPNLAPHICTSILGSQGALPIPGPLGGCDGDLSLYPVQMCWYWGTCLPLQTMPSRSHEGLQCAHARAPVPGHWRHPTIEPLVHPTTYTIDEGFAELKFMDWTAFPGSSISQQIQRENGSAPK